ncbi:MAG: hypothetical protein ACK5QT_04220 [Oligoflexia bacterium]
MATHRQKHDSEEEKIVRSIDDLAEFEDFKQALLPKLRKMVLEGWSADRIRLEVGPYIAARIAGMALLGPVKSASTLKAAQDTLDRLEGKAVQRVEQKTIYAQMSKKELAALAWQKLIDAKIISADGRALKPEQVSLPLSGPDNDE